MHGRAPPVRSTATRKSFTMHNPAHFIFGIFGNATALFLFLAPLITFKRVVRSKSTEQFSGIPYVMTLLNCLLSAWYGLPFVSKDNLLVSTINGTGAAIEAVYVLIFLIYAPRKERLKILSLFTAVMAIFSTVALVSLLVLHGQVPNGFGCVLGAVQLILYAIYRDGEASRSYDRTTDGSAMAEQQKQDVEKGPM
uniref:Bidirectional sugar transporter SWEET n=1 Tax=Kalanchoe fedtschenkoi TaxID=63787 RepID=A0A7N0UU63_KALFE